MGVVCIIPIIIILYEYITDRSAIGAVRHTDISTFGLCFWLFLWKKGILQKNVYKSRISEVGGQANYWADIPENTDVLFKWLVGTSLFLVACMIAVMPSAIWVLAGPGGFVLIASRSLIKWKLEIKHTQFRWKKINWIVIDKKQKLIVLTSHWDATRTFEDQYVYFQIFVPKDEMDDFIKIAKYYAPTCTHFEQCH